MKRLISFVFLISFSFSSQAALYKIYKITGVNLPVCAGLLEVGVVIDLPNYDCVGVGYSQDSIQYRFGEIFFYAGDIQIRMNPTNSSTGSSHIKYLAYGGGTDSCPAGTVYDDESRSCIERRACNIGESWGQKYWQFSKYGDSPKFCVLGCEGKATGLSLCFTNGNKCGPAKIVSTGNECASNGISSGGTFPEPPPNGCIWVGDGADQTLSCRGDVDGDGSPDPDVPFDDGSHCDWNGNTLECTGGTYPSQDGGNNGNSGNNGSVEIDVDLKPVIKAIDDFHNDNNSNLNKINKTNVDGFEAVRYQVEDAGENVSDTLQGLNYDMQSLLDSIKRSNEDSSNNEIVSINKVNDSLIQLNGNIGGISDGVDKIVNTDISGANFTDCYETNTCTSLYESDYSEYKDLSDFVSKNMTDISTGAIKQVTDIFTHVEISNAQRPETNACLDFGFIDFGCFDFFQDFSMIWTFIRSCFVFTAIATARKLVFGG